MTTTRAPDGLPQQVWDHLVEMFDEHRLHTVYVREVVAYTYALGLTHGRNEHINYDEEKED